MQNEFERETELKRAAYMAARNALVKRLGKDASNEKILDVVMLLVHALLTDGYRHPVSLSLHNLDFFDRQLRELIQESQKDVSGKGCGSLM